MSSNELLKWECPCCGGTSIEVVQADARVSWEIKVNKDGYWQLDRDNENPVDLSYARTLCYQCADCGERLPVKPSNPTDMDDHEDLVEYLKDNQRRWEQDE